MTAFRPAATLIAAALISACAAGAVSEPTPPAPTQRRPLAEAPPAPPVRAVASLSEIAGEWDIVRFDGFEPPRLNAGGLRHHYVDITPDVLRFAVGCNYSGMPGSIGANGVLLQGAQDDRIQTAMGCGAEREARDTEFFGFFRARPRVALLADGRLRMEGAGHSLLLERAETRRLAFGPSAAEIAGTWRVAAFLHFRNGGHQGWGPMYAPGRVRIDAATIAYSRCPGSTVRFRYTADFTLRRDEAGDRPAGPCAGARPAATEVEPMLAALLAGSPHAERVPGGRYILRNRDYGVLLTSEEDYQREFGHSAAEWERRPG
jgi:hypothetical protein